MQGMQLYQDILQKTAENDLPWIDREERNLLGSTYTFSVPKNHPRSTSIKNYRAEVRELMGEDLEADLLIVDDRLQGCSVLRGLPIERSDVIYLPAIEKETKNLQRLEELLQGIRGAGSVVGMGGGIILNATGYLAEQLNANLSYIPTTPISMSDSAIGGKVRANTIQNGRFNKHAYKSFFEPNKIIVDPRFLQTLSPPDLSIGFAEIAKHALYQSKGLLSFLLSESFSLSNRESVLKAICWTIDLKRICLDIDPEESEHGSMRVLRAAHDISDKLEEESQFRLSHGEAVLTAMKQEARTSGKWEDLNRLYNRLGLMDIMFVKKVGNLS